MVCNTCGPSYNAAFPHSLAAREIKGRSTAGYDVRIRDQPVYHRYEQVPMNHTMAPPAEELRRYGRPLTEAERQQVHYARFAENTLPPRGTGLQTWKAGNPSGVQAAPRLNGEIFWPFIGGLILGAIIFTRVGRSLGTAAGTRIARKIKG